MKVLHLTLKKIWFDKTDSGEKPDEYRELKGYWARRLLYRIELPSAIGYLSPVADLIAGDYEFKQWKAATGNAPVFQSFDHISARNGYSKNAPRWTRKCLGIHIGEGRPEWGAEPGKKYFVIKLGERIS